jgi:hypothetical protein
MEPSPGILYLIFFTSKHFMVRNVQKLKGAKCDILSSQPYRSVTAVFIIDV